MRALSLIGPVVVVLALCGLVAPGVSRWLGDAAAGWVIDLMAHWVWLWLPLGLSALLIVRWPWAARIAAVLAMLALPWWWLPPAMPRSAVTQPRSAAPQPPSAAPQQLRVVTANVHWRNIDPSSLLAWVAPLKADLIVVHELGPAYARALLAAKDWPHQHLMPRSDASGIGLLSRWPLRDVRELAGAGRIPQVHALLATPMGELEAIAIHPMPPRNLQWHRDRNKTLASLRPRGKAPALAIGDFNATPWSNASVVLVQGGWRWFGGVQPTWPHGAWGVPIDAVWGHGPWEVVSHEVGPPIGSDHRPLRVDLRLATSPP